MHKFITVSIVFMISFVMSVDSEAQRRATLYESLLQRTDQPSAYVDHVVLPTGQDEIDFAVIFRLDYDLISFLRHRPDLEKPRPEAEYFAPIRMGLEFFEGPAPSGRRSTSATPVFRNSWQDTVWVDTFEETKSRFSHVEAFIPGTLPPGEYHYELQLGRGGSIREQPSNRRDLLLPEAGSSKKGEFIILNDYTRSEEFLEASLLNYGSSVLYGQDYTILVRMPEQHPDTVKGFSLEIDKLEPGDKASEAGINRFSVHIEMDSLIYMDTIRWNLSDEGVSFRSALVNEGVPYALIQVPNQNFENSRYRIRLLNEGESEHSGQKVINSEWLDMPVSLYNLDVAIDMMKFILNGDDLEQLQAGSDTESERKFREFWAERDPTPDTEFNELMAEYYRRIDYAYNNFTSMANPGYDTDQGQSYILYGPPLNIERRLPTDAPTREIWTYPNRVLIFEATTGFGDFRLISES